MSSTVELQGFTASGLELLEDLDGYLSDSSLPVIPSTFGTACDLPAELLEDICLYLDLASLASFRLACRRIYLATTNCNYKLAFNVTSTDLSLRSLDRLDWIIRDEFKAPHVKTLLVTPYNQDHRRTGRHAPVPWAFDAYGQLMLPQAGSRWLQEIIWRLPNCQSFWFSQSSEAGGGNRRIHRPTIADAVATILPALADVKRKVKEFHFVSNDQSHYDLTPILKLGPVGHAGCPEIWSDLQSLCIECNKLLDRVPATEFGLRIPPYAPKLRDLSLTFDRYMNSERVPDVIHGLFASEFPFRLESLTLQNASCIDGALLARFLLRHSTTLRNLLLSGIHLTRGPWLTILESLGARNRFPRLESIRFDRLSEGVTECQHLDFARVLQDPVVNQAAKTEIECFAVTAWQRGQVYDCVSYSGPKMHVALKKIAHTAVLGEAHGVHLKVEGA
ncbi:hypothetical protein BJY01DRAFT_254184 [Aspergillus pseudoustus]|uniref:F-box domain-containing protein n=1 Tax=Aspergillus pseudoustus TaxID=1810923 RepID=A0ABR4IV42_9EURO